MNVSTKENEALVEQMAQLLAERVQAWVEDEWDSLTRDLSHLPLAAQQRFSAPSQSSS